MIAGLAFLLTYAVLALGQVPVFRIDRTGVAIIGAIAMVTAGGLAMAAARAVIDYGTPVLPFGTMVRVAIAFVTGALSALFVNDAVCLRVPARRCADHGGHDVDRRLVAAVGGGRPGFTGYTALCTEGV